LLQIYREMSTAMLIIRNDSDESQAQQGRVNVYTIYEK